jgi:nicotinic acid phosphoribosyltransferase
MYFIEHEQQVKQHYTNIQTYLSKHFHTHNNYNFTTNDTQQIKELIARMKKAGYIQLYKHNNTVKFTRISLSHSKKKRYTITITITKRNDQYTIHLSALHSAFKKYGTYTENEIINL